MDIDAAGTMLYTSAGAVGEQGDFQLLAVELPSGDVTLVATIEESQDAPGDITLSPDERHLYVYDQQGSNIGAGIWRVDVDQTSPTSVTTSACLLSRLSKSGLTASNPPKMIKPWG